MSPLTKEDGSVEKDSLESDPKEGAYIRFIRTARTIHQQRGLRALAIAAYHRSRALFYEHMLRKRLIRRAVFDYELLLDVRDPGISRHLLLYGSREEEHRLILSRVLRPGMTVLDIGANIGYYVLMAVRLMRGQGRVIAVEPSPENVRILRASVALNRVGNVEVRQCAVSSASGIRSLNLAPSSNLHSFHRQTAEPSFHTGEWSGPAAARRTTIDVQTVTVPELAEAHGAPDLMRMDVEGHEVEIFEGMMPMVESGQLRPMILFEAHGMFYGDDHDIRPLLRRLFAAGYSARYIGSANEEGSDVIRRMGYQGVPVVADAHERVLFEGIRNEDAVHLIGATEAVRSVLLAVS